MKQRGGESFLIENRRAVFRAIPCILVLPDSVAHRCFSRRPTISESAEDQPASHGWPALSMSMTSGARSEGRGFPFRASRSISAPTTRGFNGAVTSR